MAAKAIDVRKAGIALRRETECCTRFTAIILQMRKGVGGIPGLGRKAQSGVASCRKGLKTELLRRIQELPIARDENSAFGTVQTPGQGSGELEGVGGFEREAINEAFRSFAEVLGGEHFAPLGA
jgi:hypothetical protein